MTKTEQILQECKDKIFKKHYDIAKEKYPNESWKDISEIQLEVQIVKDAMDEYAQRMSELFADYLDKLPDLNRFTFHPGAGTGIYKKENSQLYTEFIEQLNKEKSEFDTDKNQDIVDLSRDKD